MHVGIAWFYNPNNCTLASSMTSPIESRRFCITFCLNNLSKTYQIGLRIEDVRLNHRDKVKDFFFCDFPYRNRVNLLICPSAFMNILLCSQLISKDGITKIETKFQILNTTIIIISITVS